MAALLLIAQFVFRVYSLTCDCEHGFIYNNSVEVFIGYTKNIALDEGKTWQKVTLNLKKVYKGNLEDSSMEVDVYSLSNVCGYYWNVGQYYLVFVEEISDNRRVVNQCSMTRSIFYMHDPNGTWVGIPTLEEVKDWDFQNEVMKKWEFKN
ncbi:MAG: hypothetical protein KDC44_15770 [Phaeodactylibacter sp.]|nr:hypothetical protein [Phaeodactylibacter sp.]